MQNTRSRFAKINQKQPTKRKGIRWHISKKPSVVNLHKGIKDYHVYFISSFNLLIRRCWCWINDIWILFLVWIFSISRLFQSWLGHDYLTFQPDNRAFSVIWDIFIPRARTGTLLLCIRHLHPHESLHHDANGHPDNICTVCPLFHVRCVSLSSGQRKPITGDNSASPGNPVTWDFCHIAKYFQHHPICTLGAHFTLF